MNKNQKDIKFLEQKKEAIKWIDQHKQQLIRLSDQIWKYAELPMLEYKSSRLLAKEMEKMGFRVERGVAGMPTAFVAIYGEGQPIIGFLAEYDSLPGLSQKKVPYKEPIVEGAPGHGCGHNLLGVGAASAAMAVKHIMDKYHLKGTIKLFGTPNEENDIGKLFMAREGIFNGLSAALDWHPESITEVALGGSHAIHNFKVTFYGKATHAGMNPWDGRSALHGVELMNTAVNFMREHMKPTVRIQYIITKGGEVPNVVPDVATVWYNCRDITFEGSEEVYQRILKIAEAAALATDTEYESTLLTAIHQLLVLKKSSEIIQKNLEKVGAPGFTAEEQEFARKVQIALGIEQNGLHDHIEPLKLPEMGFGGGGTDVSEVSWNAPVLRMNAACFPLGVPGHSWAVACTSGMSIGHKGMLVAAKTLATTSLDLLIQPELLGKVRAEWKELTKGKKYKNPLPLNSKPPVLPEPRKEE
jgi:aminobenzoyl-glutamate utilization protein B